MDHRRGSSISGVSFGAASPNTRRLRTSLSAAGLTRSVSPSLASSPLRRRPSEAPTRGLARDPELGTPISATTAGHTSNRVNVYVRVRAFASNESSAEQQQLAVKMKMDTVEVRVPPKGKFTFTFDGCFWSNDRECPEKSYADQAHVFEVVGRPLVENAIAGYNAAVMAYGQTGSGKTYTTYGPPHSLGTEREGLVPRVCNLLFEKAAAAENMGVRHRVSASMIEVYLEDVFDLLNHREKLKVRSDAASNSTFSVVGAVAVPVRTYEEVFQLLQKAEPLRTYAATAIHDRSSRAHTLFMLEVHTSFQSPDIAPRVSKILIADLAGCERIKVAQTDSGTAFEQARNINLSLLALGSCIEAVVARGKGSNHAVAEFRNSTLTKILKEYLGGNSVSSMLVTVAPSVRDANLSVQTLRFADRAKQITTHAKINTIRLAQGAGVDAGAALGEELKDDYQRKKEALFAEYQLHNTVSKLLKKISVLEDQLVNAPDDDMIHKLQVEIKQLQQQLNEADAQLVTQKRIIYRAEAELEEEVRRLNTCIQEMREEHEEALEAMLEEADGERLRLEDEVKQMRHMYDDEKHILEARHKADLTAMSNKLAAQQALASAAQLTAERARDEATRRAADLQAANEALRAELEERVQLHAEALHQVEQRTEEEQRVAWQQQEQLRAEKAEVEGRLVKVQRMLSDYDGLRDQQQRQNEERCTALQADVAAQRREVKALRERVGQANYYAYTVTTSMRAVLELTMNGFRDKSRVALDATMDAAVDLQMRVAQQAHAQRLREEELAHVRATLDDERAQSAGAVSDLRRLLAAEQSRRAVEVAELQERMAHELAEQREELESRLRDAERRMRREHRSSQSRVEGIMAQVRSARRALELAESEHVSGPAGPSCAPASEWAHADPELHGRRGSTDPTPDSNGSAPPSHRPANAGGGGGSSSDSAAPLDRSRRLSSGVIHLR